MSYNYELETDRAAKEAHNENQKKNAAERLKKNSDWNKKYKPKK